MKIVFFGTSNVALPVLETLYQHHDIAAVVTSPDAATGRKQTFSESPVSVLAKEMDLELLKPQKVKGNLEFINQLKNYRADIFVVVSYGKILPLEVINLPPHKTLNVHFSLLPKYRGASPIQGALLRGENQTGTSIFVLDEKMDTGPIVVQKSFPIDPDDNFITLSQKLATFSAKLLLDALPGYASGDIIPLTQDDSLATYTKVIGKQDGLVNWQNSAFQIYNQFRAYYPWPGVWTEWNGKKLKILDCQPMEAKSPALEPGTVQKDGLASCGQNTILKLGIVQLEGKNQTSVKDFLNGYPQFTGSLLGK
ncbi:MAG: methionyl-tRNA formyltransferase [Patescibacteria group bacterium]|nr:methionyl-tRNA formyltransferase [Patescibacteria group bacterium]